MSQRRVAALAWGLWTLCFVLFTPAVLLDPPHSGSEVANVIIGGLTTMTVASVGALVAARKPLNAIGWIFLAGALAQQVSGVADSYSVHALVTAHVAWPGAAVIGAASGWLRSTYWLLETDFVLLFFPTGRLPSRRWRPALWLGIGTVVYATLPSVFGQDMADQDQRLAHVHNPLGFIGPQLSNGLSGLMLLLFFVIVIICAVSVIMRFRKSRGLERQQLKWFTYAAALCLLLSVIIFGSVAIDNAANLPPSVFYVAIIGLPLGAGIAILRHRLYDIDTIINRTVVYGLLSASLIGLYLACVSAAQASLEAISGQTKPQPIVIVASTLLVVALFNPLRRRIQTAIDRRFYRAKYDAAHTLEAFAASLRAETDLRGLRERLVGVVAETMQPARVTLWLPLPQRSTDNGSQPAHALSTTQGEHR